MRQAAHFLLVMIGFLAGIVTITCACVAALFLVLANRVMPNSEWGNCWAYAVPRWIDGDGYLSIRRSEGIKLFNLLFVPHAQWKKKTHMPDSFEQFVPVKRVFCKWLPIHAIYFRGHVTTREESHEAA